MKKRATQQQKLTNDLRRLTERRRRMMLSGRRMRTQIQQLKQDRTALEQLKKAALLDSFRPVAFNLSIASLVATDEPGVLHVDCSLQTQHGRFNASKDFQIINVCYALPYMAPATMKVWRGCLQTACDILDEALDPHNHERRE